MFVFGCREARCGWRLHFHAACLLLIVAAHAGEPALNTLDFDDGKLVRRAERPDVSDGTPSVSAIQVAVGADGSSYPDPGASSTLSPSEFQKALEEIKKSSEAAIQHPVADLHPPHHDGDSESETEVGFPSPSPAPTERVVHVHHHYYYPGGPGGGHYGPPPPWNPHSTPSGFAGPPWPPQHAGFGSPGAYAPPPMPFKPRAAPGPYAGSHQGAPPGVGSPYATHIGPSPTIAPPSYHIYIGPNTHTNSNYPQPASYNPYMPGSVQTPQEAAPGGAGSMPPVGGPFATPGITVSPQLAPAEASQEASIESKYQEALQAQGVSTTSHTTTTTTPSETMIELKYWSVFMVLTLLVSTAIGFFLGKFVAKKKEAKKAKEAEDVSAAAGETAGEYGEYGDYGGEGEEYAAYPGGEAEGEYAYGAQPAS